MCTINYNELIMNYIRANPNISYDNIGTLILIDKLYEKLPDDLTNFRQKFNHFNPNLINNINFIKKDVNNNFEKNTFGILFLELLNSYEPTNVIKHRLNEYINVKLNYIDNYKNFDDNLKLLKRYSFIVSSIIDDILKAAKLPYDITEALKEDKLVTQTHDLYSLFLLFKKTKSKKIKFEILRKIGLIELILRIRRNYNIDDYDFANEKIKKLFKTGLGLNRLTQKTYYIWLDENDKVVYTQNKQKAIDNYEKDLKKRKSLAKPIYQLQNVILFPSKTIFGNIIFHYESRNKFRKNGDLSYSSVVEKIIRKNIEFPNQIKDILGIKFVLESEDSIMQLVFDLERFLGGISTRKKEKNALNKFGKKTLSELSSADFFVWKAVYDITLPNPFINDAEKIISFVKDNQNAFNFIKTKLDYYKDHPKDFIVEVQLQDIYSYFQSVVKGSTTLHDELKMRQIRVNSLYKLFPKEIFYDELQKIKLKILKKI
jgi:hypothetical protein